MIRPVRAWQDSEGAFHITREGACKAEFRRAVSKLLHGRDFHNPSLLEAGVSFVDILVENMFEIDKMIGEAVKEDTRADLSLS